MNTELKQLLNINKKSLQFLHDSQGFDFMQDYKLITSTEKLTVNKLLKLTNFDSLDNKMAILVQIEEWGKDIIYSIRIDKNNTFNPLRVQDWKQWSYGIEEMFSKKDFEVARKKGNVKKWFIFIQDKKYIIPKTKKEVDLSQRFKIDFDNSFKGIRRCFDSSLKEKYITQLNLLTTNDSQKKFNYNVSIIGGQKINDSTMLIDKSGYLLQPVHADLTKKVAEIKAKKEKEEADNSDYFDKNQEYYNKIEKVKKYICDLVMAGKSEKVRKISWDFDYLIPAYYRHLDRYNSNEYISVHEIERIFNHLDRYISNIMEV